VKPGPLDLGDAVLVVQIEGGRGEPERLWRIGRPRAGHVLLHMWASTDPADREPTVRDVAVGEVLAHLEKAARERRHLSEELSRVRRWLEAGE
jgi:hypothetical protein